MNNTLAIIGLGAMGYPVAEHLINHGFELYTVVRSERSRKKAQELGICVVDAYRDLAGYTDRILMFVSNYAQCEECLLGSEGALSAMERGTIILASTVSPDSAAQLAAACPEGVHLVDAPVSGGAVGARKGDLLVMAAGEAQTVESCRDIFECYSRKVSYIGANPGQAQAVKAVNQMLVSIHMTAAAEAMALSTGLGIDPQTMLDTITECSGNSYMFQSRMPKLIRQDFSAQASLETLEKDTGICMELAESANIPCYLTQMCHELFRQTPRSETSPEDACAVIRMYNERLK